MLDCELAQVYLSARLDGALTGEEAAALEAHLKDCPACRTLSEQLELLHQAMAEVQPAAPPAQLKADILARIAAEPRKRNRWLVWLPSAAVFALILLGAYTLTLGGSSGGGSGSPQTLDAGFVQETAGVDRMRTGGAGEPAGSEEVGGYGETAEPAATIDGSAFTASAGSTGAGRDVTPQNNAPCPESASAPTSKEASIAPYISQNDGGREAQYCGILTIPWTQAAPLLEGLSYTQEGDTRSYLLTASAFEELVQSLSQSGDIDLIEMDAQADQGLVLVTDAPV